MHHFVTFLSLAVLAPFPDQMCHSETIKRESALSSEPSAEVQGRTHPDMQERMYLDCQIKRFIFHYCFYKCWDSNRKDGFDMNMRI